MTTGDEQTRPTAELALIARPLDGAASAERVAIEPGRYVSEVLPAQVTAEAWVVVASGRVLDPPEWPRHLILPGTELLCYPRYGNFGKLANKFLIGGIAFAAGLMLSFTPAAPLGMFLMAMGAGMAAGGASQLLMGKPGDPASPSGSSVGDQAGSPTYGFAGIQNSTRVGAPIPVVYGTHRVGGQPIASSVVTQDDHDVLHMLLALSEGEIGGVSGIEINEQPVANFASVTTETRLGTNTQPAIGLFGDAAATTVQALLSLTTSFVTYTTTLTNLNAFEVKLEFPQGLFALGNNGGFFSASVSIEVDYKLSSAGGWTTGPRVTYTDAKRAVLRRSIRVDGLAAGQYDIRVRRTTAESASASLVDAVQRAAVTEIINHGFVYPNVALLAVKTLATNLLTSSVPKVTSLVTGVTVKVWSSSTQYTVAWSDNPAWVVFDMLTNPRYGMGRFVWPTEYRTGTVQVNNGSAVVQGTGTGWTANNVRKGQQLVIPGQGRLGTVLSLNVGLQQITLTANWAGLTQAGLDYELHAADLDIQSFLDWAAFCDELVPDGQGGTEKRATVNMVFDADRQGIWEAINKICGLGQAAPLKLGSYIRIKVEKASTPVQLFAMANIVKDSFEEIFMPLKERANIFEVQFLNAANNYQQDMIVLEDPALFTNSEPPRRQSVSLYGITRSSHAARMARLYRAINRDITRTIMFDVGIDAVRCEPGDVIRFQHDVPQWGFGGRAAAGSTSNTIVLDRPVTLAPATSYEVLVRHADDTVEIKSVTTGPGTVSTLGIAGTWTTTPVDGEVWAFGAVGVSTKPFRIIQIDRTEHLNARMTCVEYVASIYDDSSVPEVNQLNYSALGELAGPPGPVKNLVLLEQDLTPQSVWVSFTPPGSLNFATARIYRTDSGVDVLLGESSNGAFPISGIPSGTLLSVKVTSLSTAGVESDKSTAPTASIVTGEVHPPDVTGFTQYFEGGIAYLVWTPVSWVNAIEYELRKGTTWEAGVILGRTPLTRVPAAGDGTYWIAARDSSGAYSIVPTSLPVTGSALTQNVVVTLDEDGAGWPGTVTGDAVVTDGVVKLGGTALFDAIADLDAEPGLIDAWGGVASSGTYEIAASEIIDLGTSKLVGIVATYEARGEDPNALIDAVPDFDALATLDGSYGAFVDVRLQVAIAGNDGVFGAWLNLVPGQYVGRKFKFRVALSTTSDQVTAVLTALDITVDMPDRIESRDNVSVGASGLTVTYSPAFQAKPTVHITIVNATDGDDAKLTNESAAGFDVLVRNGGAGVARSVNWTAVGY
jgi:predicted phage tail protein